MDDERRKPTRARLANDSLLVAQQEKVVTALHDELLQIQATEDQAIRRLLTPEQDKKFDDYLKLRREMVGSSRDGGVVAEPFGYTCYPYGMGQQGPVSLMAQSAALLFAFFRVSDAAKNRLSRMEQVAGVTN